MVEALTEVHRNRFKTSGAELVLRGSIHGAEDVAGDIERGRRPAASWRARIPGHGHSRSLPPVPGLADARPLTHVEALNLERLPDHVVVLGGGYVGLEFAQAMRRFGSRVTVIEHGGQLLGREDPDVASAILQLLKDEGVEVMLGSDVTEVRGRSGERLEIKTQSGGAARTVEASDLLVAAGRAANTDRLDAARGGIELDARGYIRVNDRLETTAPGVWAMGDCAGSPMFTHVSLDDFRVVRDNLAGGNRSTATGLFPSACSPTRVGPRRHERGRSQGEEYPLPAVEHSHGSRAAHAHDLGNPRLRQSPGGR